MMIEDDYEDLLCSLSGICDKQRRRSSFNIEDVCLDKFNISFSNFVRVASRLLPLTPIIESPYLKIRYHTFTHRGIAFVKMQAKED